jgi:PAS domain S-box-containing protein
VILNTLKLVLVGSLRRQLVFGMVVVVTTIMALFVWDQTRRQQAAVLEQQSSQAIALAQSVSTSAAVWVASRDFSGLQEIVSGLARYPDLHHAIVLDTKGQVLAHTDVSRRGLYLHDLPAQATLTFLGQDAALVDVASPIMLAGTHVGWVRIGLGQTLIADRLAGIARDSVAYAVVAILLTALLATLAARRLTRRLHVIQSVADAIQAGRRDLRAEIKGNDEAAQLARQFNVMLDTLAKGEGELSQFKITLDQTLDCVFMFDARALQFCYVNQGAINQLDYSEAELLQMHAYDITPEFTEAQFRDFVAPLLSGAQDRLAFETVHQGKRGQRMPVEILLQFIASPGQAPHFVAVVRDIAERKRAEAALRELNQELEHRVEQRTADMKAAKDDAERANTAKSEFLSRMSHELRTPLNAILGFGQLLETDAEHPLANLQADNVHEILHAGTHLLALVNEVLDLSRIESGQLELSCEPIAIVPRIEACMAQIRPLAMRRGIQVDFTPELGPRAAVRADRTRLDEVLLNLLSNAVKYNREGGSIGIRCEASGAHRLRIAIRDTGRGIAPDCLPRLFKPFERMESAYEGIEGTGIGLALAKKLVEAMHGDIGVMSVPGEGSTFWFELPLVPVDLAEDEPAQVLAERALSRRKVLYIEDNLANLRLVRKIIAARKDIELLDATTAEAGLDIAAHEHPDLILLDINLPGMDGFEALRRLRDLDITREIPVIAVTANAMTPDIARGKAAGFDDYLIKPLDIGAFLKTLEVCLPYQIENKA